MTEHKGLPVSGYVAQTDDKVAVVNVNKALEERVLRQLDSLRANPAYDQRMVSLAFTGIQEALAAQSAAIATPAGAAFAVGLIAGNG